MSETDSMLATELQALVTEDVRRRLCPVGRVLDTLDGRDADVLRMTIGSPVALAKIQAVLTNNGYPLDLIDLDRHRFGTCRCRKDVETR